LTREGIGMAFVSRKGQMGDTQDGSPSAAQSALPEGGDETGPRPGSEPNFLKKIFGVFGGAEAETPAGEPPAEAKPANGAARPTLGLGNLRRMRVEDVMLPKAEIVAVEVDTPKQGLVEVFRASGMTRLPVYENTLDTPLGLVHLKDFALSHGFNGGGERYNLRKMLRPLLYVPPSMPLGVLLQKMQSGRMHMALVIDEYGGVDGLVTIEDLIEQVIGEIEDEHDTEDDRPFALEKPGCYLALARTPLGEFEAEIGKKLVDAEDEEEIDTLGGLVFMLAGRVPARGEVIHHPDGPDFEVVDADPRRIKRLRVRLAGAGARPAPEAGAVERPS
jgi:magnesium and cobalt transporter